MTDPNTMQLNRWDRFWFLPDAVHRIAWIRGGLCLIAALYFLSAWSDAGFWFGQGRPFSAESTARFWQIIGLQREASWSVSPLFLTETVWVYHAYLLVGVVVALLVFAGRGGRIASWALWLLVVGWANRAMLLSGLTETLLSLGLFAAAIAPPAAAWSFRESENSRHWTARFSARLMAVQITLVALATTGTMLAGRVWFNGWGSYALATTARNRSVQWADSWLLNEIVREPLTHLLVIALPLGLLLTWRDSTAWYGKGIVLLWCAAIAFLGSLWLYGATFALMMLAVFPPRGDAT